MPEFILPGKDKPAFSALPDMAQGFIEAMFFTECCSGLYTMDNWQDEETQHAVTEGQADGCLPADCGFDELHADSVAAIVAFCDAFKARALPLLQSAYARDYDEVQAGRDLYFTFTGSGVGFWSRDELESLDLGDKLSVVCGRGEICPWFADHVTYGDAPNVYVEL